MTEAAIEATANKWNRSTPLSWDDKSLGQQAFENKVVRAVLNSPVLDDSRIDPDRAVAMAIAQSDAWWHDPEFLGERLDVGQGRESVHWAVDNVVQSVTDRLEDRLDAMEPARENHGLLDLACLAILGIMICD